MVLTNSRADGPGLPVLWRGQAQLCPTPAYGGLWGTLFSLSATSDPESVSLGQSPVNNRFQVANPWFMLGTVTRFHVLFHPQPPVRELQLLDSFWGEEAEAQRG